MANKNFTLLICAFIISACGTGPSAPDKCDYEGPTGTCVAYDDDAERIFSGDVYEYTFSWVMECMEATNIRGPVIRITKNNPVSGYAGWTDFLTGQITLKSTQGPTQHEIVHYILLRQGFDNGKNERHEHPAFSSCAP